MELEAIAQVDYIATMSKLNGNFPKKIYKLSSCGVDPGMSVVFNKAEELCRQNPKFQSSLVVSLLKAAVERSTSPKGSNAKTDIIVLNFILLIGTYDKKSDQVLYVNIGGPGDRWVRKMNAREQKDCNIDSGKENKKATQRMEDAIERRKIQGGRGTFYLAIDSTLLMQLMLLKYWRCCMRIELSLAGNTPQHLIPIDGMYKIKDQELLDGKL